MKNYEIETYKKNIKMELECIEFHKQKIEEMQLEACPLKTRERIRKQKVGIKDGRKLVSYTPEQAKKIQDSKVMIRKLRENIKFWERLIAAIENDQN